jgi:hypothetical protein
VTHPGRPSRELDLRRRADEVLRTFALCDCRELLQFGLRHAPSTLLGDSSRLLATAMEAPLPPAIAIGAFECRLEAGCDRTDWEVCVRAEGGGRTALAVGLPRLKAAVQCDARWQRTIEFLQAWCDPESVLYRAVPVVWLEFDVADHAARMPAPFVIFTLDREAAFAHGTSLHPTAKEAITTGLALLSGNGIDTGTAAMLERALCLLPAGGRLLHVAIRPGEGAQVVRIVLSLPSRIIPYYLEQIGWCGLAAELAALMERTCATTLTQSVNLDIASEVGPRIGIEYYFPAPPASDERWRTLFDALVAAGACTAEKRAALEAWPSCATREPARGMLRIDRELLVKVVYETGAPLRAKAYLPFAARLNLSN